MSKEVSKYYSDVLKYYRFALSIPLGAELLKCLRGKGTPEELLVSLCVFLLALILIAIGGKISNND